MRVARIIGAYARIAFYDIRKFYDASGNLKKVPDLGDDQAGALAAFELEEQWEGSAEDGHEVLTKKIKLWDKLRALDSLGKHLVLFK